jgi:S-adenosylmethionine synthetase
MRPKALITELGLLAPIYRRTAAYGHFGRSEFSWEKTTRAAQIADDLLGTKVKHNGHHVGAELNGFTNGTAKLAKNGAAPKNGKAAKAGKAGKKDKKKKASLIVEA